MIVYKVEYSEHREGGPQFAAPTLRVCIDTHAHTEADNVRMLKLFKKNPDGLFSTICGDCLKVIREEELKEREAKAAIKSAEAAEVLSTALVRAVKTGRRSGHGYSDALATACDAIGGRDEAFSLTGQVLGSALKKGLEEEATQAEIDRSLHAADALLRSAAIEEKTKGPTVSLEDMPEEEIREGLFSAAQQLAVTDSEFRKLLVNDPDVRKLLLKDLGVDMLEMEAEHAVQD